MSNDFYNVSGAPSQGSFGSSATIRAEFAALQAGFDKLPVLAANNSKLLRVNSSASGLEAFTHDFLTTAAAAAAYVAKAGDTMTGALSIVAASGATSLTVRSNSGTPSQNAGVLVYNTASAVAASRAALLTLDANGGDGVGGDYAYLEMTGDNRFRVFTQASGALELGTTGATRVTIAAGGAVTINAPSSGAALTINGSAAAGLIAQFDSTNAGGPYVAFATSATVRGYFGSAAGLVSGGSIGDFAVRAENLLVFSTGGANKRLDITNGGITTIYYARGKAYTDEAPQGIAWRHQALNSYGAYSLYGADSNTGTWIVGRDQGNNANYILATGDLAGYTTRLTIDVNGKFGFNGAVGTDQVTFNGANIGFNAGTSLTQINNWGSNDLEIVTRNAASNLKFYSGNGQLALTLAPSKKATFSGGALTASVAVAFSATPTFDANASNYFDFGAMTANVTSTTISNASAGQTITIRAKQDATGGRTFAAPAGAVISGSIGTTASKASLLTLTYNGADARWEGSWLQLP